MEPDWIKVIKEHDTQQIVTLYCHTCETMKVLEGAQHQMTDDELDRLALRLGWHVKPGGVEAKCPKCVNSCEEEAGEHS